MRILAVLRAKNMIDYVTVCPKNQSIICVEDFCISYAFHGFQLFWCVGFGFEILKDFEREPP